LGAWTSTEVFIGCNETFNKIGETANSEVLKFSKCCFFSYR